MKTCPFCSEEIQDRAIVCRHCGRDLITPKPRPKPKKKGVGLEFAVAIGFGLLAAVAFFGLIAWGSR